LAEVADCVVVHCDHEFCRFNLTQWRQFLEFSTRGYYVVYLFHAHKPVVFGAAAITQVPDSQMADYGII
jgi:hypothetical protein